MYNNVLSVLVFVTHKMIQILTSGLVYDLCQTKKICNVQA